MIRYAIVFLFACCALPYSQDSPNPTSQSLTLLASTKPDFRTCGKPDPNKKISAFVELDVNTKGIPEGAFVSRSSGNACVDKITLAAAKKLRYVPPTRNGKPAVVHTTIKADF
jgi:TonB family protein